MEYMIILEMIADILMNKEHIMKLEHFREKTLHTMIGIKNIMEDLYIGGGLILYQFAISKIKNTRCIYMEKRE